MNNFQTDQFKTLTGTTTPFESEPGCNGNERVVYTFLISRKLEAH